MPEALERAIAALSIGQRAALEASEGPVLVRAAPGSGKTKVLTCAVANKLFRQPESSQRALALTFTNPAADEMRTRIRALLDDRMFRRALVTTFHSFCATVLRHHGSYVGIRPNFSVLNSRETTELLTTIAREVARTKRRASTHENIGTAALTRLKNLNLPGKANRNELSRSSDDFAAEVHFQYERALEDRNVLDFDSLISRTYRLFQEHGYILQLYQSIFHYVFVDEFQDTTYAQYALLGYLVKRPEKRVFVVADDDQTIYGWNGASALRVRQFIDDYDPRVIELTYSFRAPPEVISLANALIRNNLGRSTERSAMEPTEGKSGDDVARALWGFADEDAEFQTVVAELQTKHKGHLGSVLILGRTRSLLTLLKGALDDALIPASLRERKDEFESSLVCLLECALHASAAPDDRVALAEFASSVSSFFEIGDLPLGATSLEGVLGNLDGLAAPCLGTLTPAEFARCVRSLLIKDGNPEALASEIVRLGSAPSAAVLSRRDEPDELVREELAVWRAICSSIRATHGELADLGSFSQEMDLRSKERLRAEESVTLMTVHAAKGLEADHVYVIGLSEDEFPLFTSLRPDALPELIEEERRLCFVAITRAKRSVTLTGAKSYRGYDKLPSRFLGEMGF
jgi:DNA helicase-2/ATP-dependent DNA helicase PcrA